MIKVRPVNLHMNRDFDLNSPKSRQEDQAFIDSFNLNYTPSPYNNTWKDIQLVLDDYDYLAVIDCVYPHFDSNGNKISYFDESKAVVFQIEPYHLRSRFPITVYDETNYENRFIKIYNMCLFWGNVGLGYDSFVNEDFIKTKDLSTIISANRGTDGHIKRLDFLRNYLSRIDCDHFGNENGSGYFSNDALFSKNYRGFIGEKKLGLQDYKYHLNSENGIENDYFTEKITDSILCEALTFYNGCGNLESYLDPRCFIRVNLDDPEQALYIIQTSIQNNEWEKRIDIIRQEKKKILNELNPLNLIHNAIHGYKNYWEK